MQELLETEWNLVQELKEGLPKERSLRRELGGGGGGEGGVGQLNRKGQSSQAEENIWKTQIKEMMWWSWLREPEVHPECRVECKGRGCG